MEIVYFFPALIDLLLLLFFCGLSLFLLDDGGTSGFIRRRYFWSWRPL